jgi:hypothetical protein
MAGTGRRGGCRGCGCFLLLLVVVVAIWGALIPLRVLERVELRESAAGREDQEGHRDAAGRLALQVSGRSCAA